MSIDTKELLHQLKKTTDINQFFAKYETEFHKINITGFLNDMMVQKKLTAAAIAKKSGHGDYVYKVINGERKPSRDVLIGMAIGMELSLEECQLLLRISKFGTLDPRDRRDSVVIYGINQHNTIEQMNDLLYEMELQTL